MSTLRAAQIAQSLDLRDLPTDFYANPYPVYDWLREHEPVRCMPDSSVFLTRHADLVTMYKNAQLFSSDKLNSLPNTVPAHRFTNTIPPASFLTIRRCTPAYAKSSWVRCHAALFLI
jgi:cytochrome P450